jgi:hypothetical protein
MDFPTSQRRAWLAAKDLERAEEFVKKNPWKW